MEGGLFLLLCVIALIMGSRARNSSAKTLTDKELRKRARIKNIMIWSALGLISVILIAYIPFLFQEISIAFDTHFQLQTYLSIILFLFGIFTVYTIITTQRKSRIK